MDPNALSVVIPTRNRPGDARACVESVLAGDRPVVVVVDQSDDDETRVILSDLVASGAVRYVPSALRGAANARNVGFRETDSRIVAFTDDDCRVATDWASSLLQVFEDDPEAALVFGRVILPDELPADAFAAHFEPPLRRIQGRLPGPDVPWGIGANMAVRRDVFERVGLLDAWMGPGAFFPAGEESDLMVRVVAAGHVVINTAETSVLHLGVRSGADASALARGYAFALGGSYCKHLRLRSRPGRWLLLEWFAHFAGQAAVRALRRERPTGAGFAIGLVRGAWAASRIPLDRRAGVFAADMIRRPAGPPGAAAGHSQL